MKKIILILIAIVVSFISPYRVSAFDPGCSSGGPYNTNTGKLCSAEDIGTICPQGHVYSTVTGKLCTSWGGASSVGSNTNYIISSVLNITTASKLPSLKAGKFYSATISATGGMEGYTWNVSSGSLPPGLSVSKAETVYCIKAPCFTRTPLTISGKPTRTGKYNFSITVTSGVQKTTKPFFIEITTS